MLSYYISNPSKQALEYCGTNAREKNHIGFLVDFASYPFVQISSKLKMT